MLIEPYYTQKERHAICRVAQKWPEVLVLHKEQNPDGEMILTLSCGHKSPRRQHRAINAADEFLKTTSRVVCEACAQGKPTCE